MVGKTGVKKQVTYEGVRIVVSAEDDGSTDQRIIDSLIREFGDDLEFLFLGPVVNYDDEDPTGE